MSTLTWKKMVELQRIRVPLSQMTFFGARAASNCASKETITTHCRVLQRRGQLSRQQIKQIREKIRARSFDYMQSAYNHYLRETRQEVTKGFRALEISYQVISACSLHHHIQNKRRQAVSHLTSAVHVSFVLATSCVHVSVSCSSVHWLKVN